MLYGGANLPLYGEEGTMVTMLKRTIKLLCITLVVIMSMTVLTACSTSPAQYTGDDEDLKRIYDMGLVDKDASLEGGESLTWAQALMLVSRADADAQGTKIKKARGEWYDSYIEYALKREIITAAAEDASRPVLKHELAQMLAFISKLPEINGIDVVPDTIDLPYSDAVLSLYRQGVTLGVNERGDFAPGSEVEVKDACTMLLRALGKADLLEGTFDKISNDDAYYLVTDPSWNAWFSKQEGIPSGWTYDNRGGEPRNTLYGSYGTLADISTEAGTALIRPLSKTSTGILDFFARMSIDGKDGVYVEFRNEADTTVWQLMVQNDAWNYKNADGTYTELVKLEGTRNFDIRASIDLDNCVTTIYINGKSCGAFALCTSGDDCHVYELRFATTDEGTPVATVVSTQVTANYAVNEEFTYITNGQPFNWELDGAAVENAQLSVKSNGIAKTEFAPVSGNAIAEFMYLYNRTNKLKYTLSYEGTPIVVLQSDEAGFTINGEQVYACDFDDLWYRFRLEFDFGEQSVLVKVNGREAKTVPVLAYTTVINSLTIENGGENAIQSDNFKVFRMIDHEDYVPEPVVPEDKDDYIVGMNVCSLWRNGEHIGWSCISPFDDPTPVLGYYDEGIPETADWEIKYIVEHGIDFQAFCIYMDGGAKPQRPATKHLYDGFMNAKYSSLSKYCVIWECQNAGSPYSMDEWKEYYIPYFVENYFKDPRYMIIDNKPVLFVFGEQSLADRIGGYIELRHAFEYLDEEIKKYGFDGMIYVASNAEATSRQAQSGFDAACAYNWGKEGYQLDITKTHILDSASKKGIYTVPTISVGFNNLPWDGKRSPMMSFEDYAEAQEWVKNEYLPKYAKEDWQKKLVMISTWNEYGEGTYIMPTNDGRGFGYLDILREAYTSEKADPSLNTVPTESQLYRINRIYPQYHHLLRYSDENDVRLDPEELDSVYKIDLSEEIKGYISKIDNVLYGENGISGTTATSKASIAVRQVEAVDLDTVDYICIRAKVNDISKVKIYYLAGDSVVWELLEENVIAVPAENGFTDYYILVTDVEKFTGKFRSIRIDLGFDEGTPFTLTSIELLSKWYVLTDILEIDGSSFTQKIKPFYNRANELYIAFDPEIGLDYALNAYHEWDKATKTLTIAFVDHTVVYQVGSDICTVDGEQIKLSCKIEELGALPFVPIEQICDLAGYELTVTDGQISIITDNNR